ncbi:uncharacterized protein LOC142025269 [Carettochelys insculpta]|uniref:uncharacterized protein LOC142025269 n=1 Tax=Carettochelys insculpta TaxID=44489 RepID=UPI003EC0AE15
MRKKGAEHVTDFLGLPPQHSFCFFLHWGHGLGRAQHRGLVEALRAPPYCPIMVPAATILFLGCWLARRSRVSGQGTYPKPSISASPSGVIPIGGNVTIRCSTQRQDMRFVLYKAGAQDYVNYTDPAGSEAEFPITGARKEHSGDYTCRYSHRTGPAVYSELSDSVQIIVAERSGPQTPPGLSSPLVTGVSVVAATVLLLLLLVASICVIVRTRARKGAAPTPNSNNPVEASKVPTQQDPVYDSVNKRKELQTLPQEPDPEGLTYVELNHQARQTPWGDPAPAPTPEPAQYSMYTVIKVNQEPHCDSPPQPWGAGPQEFNFLLCHCAGRLLPGASRVVHRSSVPLAPLRPQPHGTLPCLAPRPRPHLDPPPIGCCSCNLRPLFRVLPSMSPENSLSPASWQPPFKSYPKPSLSLSPSGEFTPGTDVSFYCHGSRAGVRFRLYRAGVALRHTEPATSTAEFRITNARREDGGTYTCRYESLTEPPVVSPPSDPIELVAVGEWLSSVAWYWNPGAPATKPPPPASCTLTTRHHYPPETGGEPTSPGYQPPSTHPCALTTKPHFPCHTCCQSGCLRGGAVFRQVYTKIASLGSYPKPSISLSPSGELTPGMDVSFYCHGSRAGVRFRLYRAGIALRHMEPATSTAEFRITNARREDGGTYTCRYESLTEPPVVSLPSDPIELVIAGSYPKPSISLSPSGELTPGMDVSFYCHGSRAGVRFRLYRAGVALRHTEPATSTAEFRITNARREDGGTYTCRYESLTEPPIISLPSDPIELVVTDGGSRPTRGTDPTQLSTAPAPTHPGSTGPGCSPRQGCFQANVVRLALAAGVLLALGLVVAEAIYSCLRSPPAVSPSQPHGEQGRPPSRETEAPAWSLQPPAIPAGRWREGHAPRGGPLGGIGPGIPSGGALDLVSPPHSPPLPLPPQISSSAPSYLVSPPPPLPPQISSRAPSYLVFPPSSPPPPPPPQISSRAPSYLVSPPPSPPPPPPPQISSGAPSYLVSPPPSPPPPPPPQISSGAPSYLVSPPPSPPPPPPPQISSRAPSYLVFPPSSPPPTSAPPDQLRGPILSGISPLPHPPHPTGGPTTPE